MTLSLLGPIGLPVLVCVELATIFGFISLHSPLHFQTLANYTS